MDGSQDASTAVRAQQPELYNVHVCPQSCQMQPKGCLDARTRIHHPAHANLSTSVTHDPATAHKAVYQGSTQAVLTPLLALRPADPALILC
eukprot:1161587-Pelagomonas_calceolata.AAC.18